jgi:hypothetical protein
MIAEAVGQPRIGRIDRGRGRGSRFAPLGAGQHIPGQLFGLLDVRLVERVDAEDSPSDRRRHLPADELGTEVDRVGDGDPDDGMAGRLERVGERIAAAIRPAVEGEADEDPIVPIRLRPAERFEIDRHDPDAMFAGALGDQLLRPRAERRDLVVRQERQLVAACARQRAHRDAER